MCGMYASPECFVDFEYSYYKNIGNSFLLCVLFAGIIGISLFFRKNILKEYGVTFR